MQPGGLRARRQVSRGPQVTRGTQSRSKGAAMRNKSNGRPGAMPGAGKYMQQAGAPSQSMPNISGDVINYLKDELLATWEAYLIPDYHRTVFLDCIYGLKP